MKILFFDLENTIIDHFSTFKLIKQDFIRTVLDQYPDYRIGIYSYALWCENNLKIALEKLKEFENYFNVVIDKTLIPLVPEMQRLAQYRDGKKMTMHEFWINYPKMKSFIHFSYLFPQESTLILVDDTVDNSSVDILSTVTFIKA